MKKFLMIIFLFIIALSNPVFANDTDNLKTRLSLVNSFHVIFNQKIINFKGEVIQEGKGELWVKKPNLFNWHMITPDDNLLISDGKTVWFYNHLLEQVTANWLKTFTKNTPFMLIIRNNASDWYKYNVTQHKDSFTLIPKIDNNSSKKIEIKITSDGNFQKIINVEKNGQCIIYEIKNQTNGFISEDKFHFLLPKNVILDDQRDIQNNNINK